MKHRSLYSNILFDKIMTPSMVVCSYVFKGQLSFIDGGEIGIMYNSQRGFGGGFRQFDIDMDIPQKNDFTKLGRNSDIETLELYSYNYKSNDKIDFDSRNFYLPYALKMLDNGQILRPCENQVQYILEKYKDLQLEQFLARNLHNFTNNK